MKYLYHHLGLGDHILCNGLVREMVKKYDSINLFCKTSNLTSVSSMYHDLQDRLTFIAVKGDPDVYDITNQLPSGEVINIGHRGNPWNERCDESFDVQFYKQAGLSINKKYNSFFIDRTGLPQIPVPDGEYIFVHEDKPRGYSIDWTKLPDGKSISAIKGDYPIFAYLPIIEKATEIHVIDSAFLCLIDCMLVRGKKFLHKYARPTSTFETVSVTSDWKIYNE